uniref:Uncharacterized protein n=1 Tax=Arcella intermedia TaxID=1963864 RepID=A0A6B2L749_9EUKA
MTPRALKIGCYGLDSRYYNLHYPITNGIVRDWYDLETILTHIFVTLGRHRKIPIVVVEPPIIHTDFRERMCQLLFETFHCSSIFFSSAAVLSLYSYGIETGLFVDIGESGTRIVPVYCGCIMRHAVFSTSFGGRNLTEFLCSSYNLQNTGVAYQECEWLKKDLCCFTENNEKFSEVTDYFLGQEYNLSTRSIRGKYDNSYDRFVMLSTEVFECPEKLFKENEDKSFCGVQHHILQVINGLDEELQAEFFSNIVVSGGSCLFPGFAHRLKSALKGLTGYNVDIILDQRKENGVWIGANKKVLSWEGRKDCITKKDYFADGCKSVSRLFW